MEKLEADKGDQLFHLKVRKAMLPRSGADKAGGVSVGEARGGPSRRQFHVNARAAGEAWLDAGGATITGGAAAQLLVVAEDSSHHSCRACRRCASCGQRARTWRAYAESCGTLALESTTCVSASWGHGGLEHGSRQQHGELLRSSCDVPLSSCRCPLAFRAFSLAQSSPTAWRTCDYRTWLRWMSRRWCSACRCVAL